jgi:hypothetical protein
MFQEGIEAGTVRRKIPLKAVHRFFKFVQDAMAADEAEVD